MADQPEPYTFRLGRGLNTAAAPALLQEGEVRRLENWRITGTGRLTPRRALIDLANLDDIVAIFAFPYAADTAAAVLNWDGDAVQLYRADGSGQCTLEGNLSGYTIGVTSRPRFTGAVLNQALFLADTGKEFGLTVWDPNQNLGDTSFFQPTFSFSGATDAPAYPNIIVELANHLWMFGHGDETTPDRGEIGRWSYLGLVNDGQGSGDAGVGGATGSENLFDVEDFNPSMCARGDAIRGAIPAGRRMVVMTQRQTRILFGSDRSSWAIDTIDDERGIAHELAGCRVGNNAYWMSLLGPTRYRGGDSVEPLEAPILDLVDQIAMESVVAVSTEFQARFYYALKDEADLGANRCLIYDERVGAFLQDTHAVRIFAAGNLRPSGLDGPAGPATNLTHHAITAFGARAQWTPGDTSPETTQIVSRRQGTGPWIEQARYPGGQTYHPHAGLQEFTEYSTRVETIRNGLSPDSGEPLEASFVTARAPVDPDDPSTGYRDPPTITVEDYPTFGGPSVTDIQENVLVTISLPAGLFELQRKTTSSSSSAWQTIWSSPALPTQYLDSDVSAGLSLDYRARNVVEGDPSDWTPVQTVTPSYNTLG